MNKELEELRAELPEHAQVIDKMLGAAKKITYMQSAFRAYEASAIREVLDELEAAQVELLGMIAA